MDLDLTPITNNSLVTASLKIAAAILLELKVVGELTKDLKRTWELIDNFFKI